MPSRAWRGTTGCSPEHADGAQVQAVPAAPAARAPAGALQRQPGRLRVSLPVRHGARTGPATQFQIPLGTAAAAAARDPLARGAGAPVCRARRGKARTLLMTAYGTGLAPGELCHLRVGDIDSHADRMCIRVVQGKGAKDRYVPLPADVLQLLRAWWRQARTRAAGCFAAQRDAGAAAGRATAPSAGTARACAAGRHHQARRHPHAAPLLCHPSAGSRRGPVQPAQWLGHRHVSTTMRYLHLARPDAPDGARRDAAGPAAAAAAAASHRTALRRRVATTLAEVLRHFGPAVSAHARPEHGAGQAWRAIVSCRTAGAGRPAAALRRLRRTSSGAGTRAATGTARSARARAARCLARRAAGRVAGRAVLPPGVHAAARAQRAGRGARALGLRHADAVHGRHAHRVRRQRALAGRHRRLHAGAAHLDAGPAAPPACARADGLRGACSADRRRRAAWSRPSAQRFLFPVQALSQGVSRQVPAARCSRPSAAGALPRDPAATRRCSARSAAARCDSHDWVVYAKTPLAGPAAVLDYLSRYTHRTAIGNERLVAIDGDKVLLRVRADATRRQAHASPATAQQFIAPLPAACAARGLQAHPPLRAAGPGGQGRAAGAGARAAGHAGAQPAGARGRAGLHAPRGRHRDRPLLRTAQVGRWQLVCERRRRSHGAGGAAPARLQGAAMNRDGATLPCTRCACARPGALQRARCLANPGKPARFTPVAARVEPPNRRPPLTILPPHVPLTAQQLPKSTHQPYTAQ